MYTYFKITYIELFFVHCYVRRFIDRIPTVEPVLHFTSLTDNKYFASFAINDYNPTWKEQEIQISTSGYTCT